MYYTKTTIQGVYPCVHVHINILVAPTLEISSKQLFIQRTIVLTVHYVLLEAVLSMKEEWRSAMTTSGGLCVMIFGVVKMPWWLAFSWGFLQWVCWVTYMKCC